MIENCAVDDCQKRILIYRIEALEAALREISDLRYRDIDGGMMAYAMSRVARTALAPEREK